MIECVTRPLSAKHGGDIFNTLASGSLPALPGAAAQVRGEDDLFHLQKPRVDCGFVLEDVEAGPCQTPFGKLRDQGFFLHDAAPCHVDDDGSGFHLPQPLRVKEATCLRSQGTMQGEDIGLSDHLVQTLLSRVGRGFPAVKMTRIPKASARRRTAWPTLP